MQNSVQDLLKMKIPILASKAADNNIAILQEIAINGPLLKYDIYKQIGTVRYSTISRRIDDLAERGYVGIAKKRVTTRGKHEEEAMYGLKWKGLIACLSIKRIRENVIEVLRINPLLAIPEKMTILAVAEEITLKQERDGITNALFEAYLEVLPNIETVREDQLWIYALAIRDFSKLKQMKLSQIPKDVFQLLDRPVILKIVKEKIAPFIEQQATQFALLNLFFGYLNDLTSFIKGLDNGAIASVEVKKFIENKKMPTSDPKNSLSD